MMQQEGFAYMRIKEKWPDEVCYYCGGRKRHQKKRERENGCFIFSYARAVTVDLYRVVQNCKAKKEEEKLRSTRARSASSSL